MSDSADSQSSSTPDLVPRLLRTPSKSQSTQHVNEYSADPHQAGPASWMSKQKTTAIGHFTKLTHRGRTTDQVTDDTAEWTSQVDAQNDNLNLVVPDDPEPSSFAKRMQGMFSTIPSFSTPGIGLGSSRSTSPPVQTTGADDVPPPVRDPHPLAFLTLPSFDNSFFEHGWKSFCASLDRLRLPYGKQLGTSSEPSKDEVLDCIDDNNSVMMYGPLEPDDTSEVEIACSEIVSINGDGEEIRTPQPCFTPLPSESIDEALLGRGPRSPPPRFVPLALESIDQVLMGGAGEVSSVSWRGHELENDPTTGAEQVSPTGPEPDRLPVKEYRVWLPSTTKISIQTMWWGFRIYLPPPVLDVLNNRQLEAAKRAAIITTALQWLMDHLPVSLLPPQMRPGVAILRHLVPYVGYMGGFVAWSWSAIRSFDKGYGVVLTATWLLPFVLIPGTWEADEVPNLNADLPPSISS